MWISIRNYLRDNPLNICSYVAAGSCFEHEWVWCRIVLISQQIYWVARKIRSDPWKTCLVGSEVSWSANSTVLHLGNNLCKYTNLRNTTVQPASLSCDLWIWLLGNGLSPVGGWRPLGLEQPIGEHLQSLLLVLEHCVAQAAQRWTSSLAADLCLFRCSLYWWQK